MEKYGLLGVWTTDCSAGVSAQNAYTMLCPLDERRVQRDTMIGAAQRAEALENKAKERNPVNWRFSVAPMMDWTVRAGKAVYIKGLFPRSPIASYRMHGVKGLPLDRPSDVEIR